MQIYLVGGAVRDALLQLPVTDQDWVVVGATPQTLLNQGYQQVGRDFPVFLHPKTQQEYALARTERKSGLGYTGFVCDFTPEVTLEQDLLRRDLTINAIAQDAQGHCIDPYHGLQDLNNKKLRHVSPAFIEDPLRVLRVARFAARFAHLGFTVAAETLSLMQEMVLRGELNHLTPERVWKEWEKSLSTPNPEVFLQVLRQCGALSVILPELNALFGVPQSPNSHPEVDTGTHTLLVAQQAAQISQEKTVRFAAQLHDLGKGLTDPSSYPKHPNHEQSGLALVTQLCDRLRVPNEYKQLSLIACAEHTTVHDIQQKTASEQIDLFDRLDAWRKPDRIQALAEVSQADHQGRIGFEQISYPQAHYLLTQFNKAKGVLVQPIIAAGFKGADIKTQWRLHRIAAIQE